MCTHPRCTGKTDSQGSEARGWQVLASMVTSHTPKGHRASQRARRLRSKGERASYSLGCAKGKRDRSSRCDMSQAFVESGRVVH